MVSNSIYGDRIEKSIEDLLNFELKIVNKHLPIQRQPLKKLLNMDVPHVKLRDGSVHIFRRSELEALRRYLNEEDAERLELPIIVILRPDIGEGIGIIDDPIAVKVVAKILGITLSDARLTLYKPHIAMLRRYFDTLFQFAIVVEQDPETR